MLAIPGDIAYTQNAWQGAVGVSAFRGIVSPAYVIQTLRCTDTLTPSLLVSQRSFCERSGTLCQWYNVGPVESEVL